MAKIGSHGDEGGSRWFLEPCAGGLHTLQSERAAGHVLHVRASWETLRATRRLMLRREETHAGGTIDAGSSWKVSAAPNGSGAIVLTSVRAQKAGFDGCQLQLRSGWEGAAKGEQLVLDRVVSSAFCHCLPLLRAQPVRVPRAHA